MVSNPRNLDRSRDLRNDLLGEVADPATGKVDPEQLAADERSVVKLVDAARPGTGRGRDGYYNALYRTWWINLLYYAGQQGLDMSDFAASLDHPAFMRDTPYVANHILRLVVGNVARLSGARVDWSVVPSTPDLADREGAKVAQHMLDYAYEHLDLQRRRIDINFWLDTCGTAFIYTGWDVATGTERKFYYDPMTGQPVAAQQMRPQQLEFMEQMGAYDIVRDGDWDVEVLSPFSVIGPIGIEEMRKWPWALIRRKMSVEDIWDRWPDKANGVEASHASPRLRNQYDRRLATMVRPGLAGIGGTTDQYDAVDVDELWCRPSSRCPGGFYAIVAGETVLESGVHPIAAKGVDIKIPLVDFHNIKLPGRFHSMSTVEHLLGPQMEYNKGRQQIIEHRDTLSVPQWTAPQGSITKGAVRNEVGDILEYNPRFGPPNLVSPPPLGQAQIVSVQQATSDLQMISSFSEASLGQMPSGARSGNAVMALQERDMLGIGPVVSSQERSWQQVGSHLLMLASVMMRVPRAMAIYGDSRQADIRYFLGKSLHGQTRVWIKPGSMTPKSKAATLEMMQALMGTGAINVADPRQQRMVLETLEVGGMERFYALQDAARRRARIENLMFSKPDPSPHFAFPDVQLYDDHQAHFEEHLAFIYTDEYELLDPWIKMMFQAHVQKHTQAIAQMMAAQAAVAAGQGPAQGQGSPQAKPLGRPSPPNQKPQAQPA